jgi:hypothetical protein
VVVAGEGDAAGVVAFVFVISVRGLLPAVGKEQI